MTTATTKDVVMLVFIDPKPVRTELDRIVIIPANTISVDQMAALHRFEGKNVADKLYEEGIETQVFRDVHEWMVAAGNYLVQECHGSVKFCTHKCTCDAFPNEHIAWTEVTVPKTGSTCRLHSLWTCNTPILLPGEKAIFVGTYSFTK
jgi:hypothetical protein